MKTIEQKAKAYDEAIRKAKKLYEQGTITESLNYVFPELAMSEDEKIRKELCKAIWTYIPNEDAHKYIAWLEKQKSVEEIVERCKDSWYNEGKIAGMAEGLSDDEKYQQGWHDAVEKQNKQKAIWHADDEKNLNAVLSFIEDEYLRRWLKDTIHKEYDKSTEWSEEDERMMLSIEQVMNCASLLNIVPQKIDKVRTWLKSIKERIE